MLGIVVSFSSNEWMDRREIAFRGLLVFAEPLLCSLGSLDVRLLRVTLGAFERDGFLLHGFMAPNALPVVCPQDSRLPKFLRIEGSAVTASAVWNLFCLRSRGSDLW